MDILSLLGLFIAIGAVIGGQWLEGGHLASLLQATAFFIVIGGTLGAVLLQSRLPVFAQGVRMARWVFQPPPCDYRGLISRVIHWSNVARRGGLLALEPQVRIEKAEYERKGLQLLIDGADPVMLREILERDIDTHEDTQLAAVRIWEAAAGYAPTIGILGAVLGLIHVMENLTDPTKLGAGIAVAFVATIYGVGAANLLFLPVANKLKSLVAREVKRREMLIDGLVCVANGENPRIIQGKLEGYLAEGD
ncbi:MAG: flagellar motor protein [Betaproteobacteria bacterium]|nr:flagellar motor protein [Betaproteobacteria bacterium]MBL8535606.1 flagellar motor protein [Betaproteobacteria bacterium]